jgi:5'-phosphate synthase pdxT subunit
LRIGVLALQGDYLKHCDLLEGLGVEAFLLRRSGELEGADGIVLPGGESTTLHRLLRFDGLAAELTEYGLRRPIFGTCAGLILMAKTLSDAGGVEPLGLLDVEVRRNGFGRQIDSFEGELTVESDDPQLAQGTARGMFIRAPRILDLGSAECLARWSGEAVAVRQGNHMGLSFHPELAGDARWHRAWLSGCAGERPA